MYVMIVYEARFCKFEVEEEGKERPEVDGFEGGVRNCFRLRWSGASVSFAWHRSCCFWSVLLLLFLLLALALAVCTMHVQSPVLLRDAHCPLQARPAKVR